MTLSSTTAVDTATGTRPATDPVATGSHHRPAGAALALGGLLLLAGLVVAPGPDITDVHSSMWVPGHALHVAAFPLILMGFPAVVGSLGRQLDRSGAVFAAIGYVAVMVRCALSTGSHVYSMCILPQLARHPELNASTHAQNGGLASIYAGHGDLVNLAVGAGFLALAVAFWGSGRTLRAAAVLTVLIGVGEALGNPIALLLLAVLGMWLGLRLVVRDDARSPLRTPKAGRQRT